MNQLYKQPFIDTHTHEFRKVVIDLHMPKQSINVFHVCDAPRTQWLATNNGHAVSMNRFSFAS